MSDKQKGERECPLVAANHAHSSITAFASLELVLATSDAGLALLLNPQKDSQTHQELPVLRKDLLSLLSLLDHSTTKLALALKPSDPTYSASLTPIKDIVSQISALAQCAHHLDRAAHGATLVREIVSVVKDVINSVKSLVQTFRVLDQPGLTSEYLVKVGTVHDIIDKARSTNGISESNVIAVRKKWVEDNASLEDGLREVNEMIRSAEDANITSPDNCDDEFMENDGWDELGLGSSKKMEKSELDRSKKVCPSIEWIWRITFIAFRFTFFFVCPLSCTKELTLTSSHSHPLLPHRLSSRRTQFWTIFYIFQLLSVLALTTWYLHFTPLKIPRTYQRS